MNTQFTWENDAHTILRCTLAGEWDVDQFYAQIEQESCGKFDPRLCVIVDLREVTRVPSDAVLQLKRAAALANHISGTIVVIAGSVTTVTMYRLFTSIYKPGSSKFALVSSDAEAYAVLGIPR